jgi:flagella basal body P-ring formation protein FlgA
MKYAFQISCGSVGMWIAACSVVYATTEITLRERVVINGTVVKLGDLAEVVTADRAVGRKLAAQILIPAPAPGTQRFLRDREIQDLLSAQGEDIGQLRFAGASQVALVSPALESPLDEEKANPRAIDREGVMLAGRGLRNTATRQKTSAPEPLAAHVAEELRDKFCQAIIEYLTVKAGRGGAWRVECDVPERHLSQLQFATAAPKCFGGAAPWTGKQRFLISFPTTDGMAQAAVYAQVSLATQVVVAILPIERGATITAAHIELQAMELSPPSSSRRTPAGSVEELIGMEAKTALQIGDVVYSDQVQSPLLVKRGELVAVVSQGGGIRVRTTARARQDAAMGELVQVETLETKAPFDARVTGPGEATVFAGVTPAIEASRARDTGTIRRR